jgi:hypothetical protein
MEKYRVHAHRSDGWWALEFTEVDDRLHSQVRRLDQAAEMAADAITMWRAEEGLGAVTADQIEVVPVLAELLDKDLRRALERRRDADVAAAEAMTATRLLVADCLAEGMSMRDVGVLLHVSHQYIGKLAKELQAAG